MATSADTQAALFSEIKRQVSAMSTVGIGAPSKAAALRDLAAAYRHAAGGPQPGGSASGE
ncbi:hypothetical protein ASE01_20020 [Nocardioides sp. Root190]|uniref:hypothetical protein n=1 Tax=Nocardioides sp. Root190 TaxID=1736488 RepID=UPI0006F3F498|nr:hypothetical protein [Nocardioides sp. Root190]KRB73065.1 hypothetical protein ASE01_20020 [Nocardioides sp. Root190]